MANRSKPRPSGGAHRAGAGLVLIAVNVTPAERDTLRVAAAHAGERGMGAFARRHALEAARKLLKEKGVAEKAK